MATASSTSSASTDDGENADARRRALVNAMKAVRRASLDRAFAEVVPGVFVGAIGAARDEAGARARGVTHVLSLCSTPSAIANANERTGGEDVKDDFVRLTIDIADSPEADIASKFDECYAFIARALSAGGRALVHCFQGKSRSVTICAMYVMRARGCGCDDALNLVRASRPMANPNEAFVAALRDEERRLTFAANAKARVANDE